jgi:type IV pilus assembly protein PilB
MSVIFNKKLYTNLKDLEVISDEQLDLAFKESSETKTLGSILLDRDLISDDNLGKITADIHGISFVDFDSTPVDFDVFPLIPETLAKKHGVVAFRLKDHELHLAMHHPDNIFITEAIAKKTGFKTKIFYATKRTIANVLSQYAKDFASTFNALIQEYEASKEITNKQKELEAPIIKAVDMIFDQSYQQKASDVHIEPEDEVTILRFRIDGILKDIVRIPKELHDQIVTRIKVMGGLRTDEHQSPQDGKLHFDSENDKVDVRVSIVPTTDGEKVVMRLLSDKSRRLSLTDLGFSSNDLKKVKNAATKPYGMILATGPTGSGKTTTLYSLVKILNKPDINIMTIEDPVEYDVERINQIQVNNKAHLTFAEGLKSIVRQDPDIILVGEIRDEETASIAINSAMTGHLVLSSVHTNDAATAFPRLIDMDIEPFLVASSVNLIVAQRLVRKICQNCIVSKQVKVSEIIKSTEKVKRGDGPVLTISESLVSKHFPGQEKIRVYEGKGCEVCHQSGYTGRIGIFEVLEVTEKIKELIALKSDSSDIETQAISDGMDTMFDDGLEKVKQGQTSLEEIMRVAKE